jgi:hypothetical protein
MQDIPPGRLNNPYHSNKNEKSVTMPVELKVHVKSDFGELFAELPKQLLHISLNRSNRQWRQHVEIVREMR